MIGTLRKFSSSIYAKILFGIIIVPFVFWGMGSSFVGGNKNVIVKIDSEKHSVQEFLTFISHTVPPSQKIDDKKIDQLLTLFIAEKLIEMEVENFGINLSDSSLSKLIKNQNEFKREGKFSRTEYEKYLLLSNMTAVDFEKELSALEKKKHLLNFIGGGINPSKFHVNQIFDKINQKRNIQILDLNKIFQKKLIFTDKIINDYYQINKNKFLTNYKTINLLELNPKNVVGNDEFNDNFFKKLDEIDELIIDGKSLEFILKKFSLQSPKKLTFDKTGLDLESKKINDLEIDLIKKIHEIDESEEISLIETNEKYLLVEIIKTENIQKKITNKYVINQIKLDLEMVSKRKFISEITSKINSSNFSKSDFNKLSSDEGVSIKNIKLENKNDDKDLKKELVDQIYKYPEKKVFVLYDILLTENYLIYIDKVENVVLKKNSDEYQKYINLSKIAIANELYNTYDMYIKNKYEVEVNYKTLETVKNSFIY